MAASFEAREEVRRPLPPHHAQHAAHCAPLQPPHVELLVFCRPRDVVGPKTEADVRRRCGKIGLICEALPGHVLHVATKSHLTTRAEA